MFRIENTILSEEIATAKFACDVTRCKGACCFVGEAGAPLAAEEIPIIRKAWRLLEKELRPEAKEAVQDGGIIRGDEKKGFEIGCVDGNECIFVQYDESGIAHCAIQKAFYEGKIGWEKPVSCHLYPVRLKRISGIDYANFEYIPDLCSAGCDRGEKEGVWLSDFLKSAFTRRYGETWYSDFSKACNEIRNRR
ncbi:MAG: DUF3109 family protein [Balneolaceae bacterium]